ncbi:ABC transporter substrate-binding protein [Paenibacillus chungangensis]|uniref:ABC transporter substrate-binding protein n=1 Tax=Paenibacillus chungangensis TaxID=696535 RepID=A0ABW3HKV0_9BACL
MKKKTGFIMLIALLLAAIVAGCSSQSNGNKQGGHTEGNKEQGQEANQTKPGSEVEIEFVHYQTGQQDAIEELLQRYYEETGVRVTQTLIDAKTNQQYLITRAQEGKFPDIYGGSLGGEVLANLVMADLVEDLTPEWEEWGYDVLGENKSFKGYLAPDNEWGAASGKYSIPYVVATSGYFYNMSMLNEVGFQQPPVTWNEFLELNEKLKQGGISPVAYDLGDNWGTLNQVIFPLATNIFGGEEAVIEAVLGDNGMSDPRWIEVFGTIDGLREQGYLAEGTVVLTMPDVEKKFVNGEVAVISNGSWFVPMLKQDAPDLDWAVAAPPKVMDSEEVNIDGGVSISLSVAKSSEFKEESKVFIRWFTDDAQQIHLAEKSGVLPANSQAMDKASLDENVKILAGLGENLTKRRMHEIVTEAKIYEEFWKGVQMLVGGKTTPEGLQQSLMESLANKK